MTHHIVKQYAENAIHTKAEIPYTVMQMNMSDCSPRDSFCIELTTPVNDRIDVRDVRRAIEYLGGIQADSEFAFVSEQRRDESLTILCAKYGTSYFASKESEVKEGQHEGTRSESTGRP